MPAVVRPVAVTGIGIVSPLGASAAAHWAAAVAGTRAVRRLQPEETIAIDSASTGWREWFGAPAVDCSGNVAGMAMTAATEALRQAGLFTNGVTRKGVVLGASKPVLSGDPGLAFDEWRSERPQLCDSCTLSAPARAIAGKFQVQGPVLAPSAACATGLVSVIRGADLIREGVCDIVIAGSADSSLHPAYLAAYRRMGVLADAGEDPAQSCRPFDARRQGFAVGEGAAVLVLESIEHARRRGAGILAEILGAGLTSDPESLVDAERSGKSLARAARDALDRSGVTAADIDAASLHGTGTAGNDVGETNALKRALGQRAADLSCFSIKGGIGHLMGAAGSVETATLVQALTSQIVPPTVNLERPDPECDLDYTAGRARERTIRAALKLSQGFGGTCAALVIRRPETI